MAELPGDEDMEYFAIGASAPDEDVWIGGMGGALLKGDEETWTEVDTGTEATISAVCATELSKGEGTRLRLVLAMAFRPLVLVLDEPATGLDVAGRRALMEAVYETVKDPRRSVIISSHHLGDLERIADWLVVLDRGRIVREGPPAELLGDGRSLEEALLGWTAAARCFCR